jgi:peptidoglycan/xylan/chitin deacetylase (PgdA/CDA1 family)
MGYKHWHLMNAAADAGHSVVTWSLRARDTKATSADAILSRLVQPARGGDVIVLHDGNDPCLPPSDRAGTRAAVRPLIDALRARGFELVRLDELLGIRAYHGVNAPA